MSKAFQFEITFGWSAPSISDQLKAFGVEGVDPQMVEHWQKNADAVLRCAIRDLVPNAVVRKARHGSDWIDDPDIASKWLLVLAYEFREANEEIETLKETMRQINIMASGGLCSMSLGGARAHIQDIYDATENIS